MSEIFDDGPELDAFVLPSDAALYDQLEEGEQPTTAAAEPAAADTEPEQEPDPQPEADAAPAEEPTDTPTLDVDDPAVQEYLAKFGGDPAKALKAAVEAQSVIGRQGQELGELRRLFEERLTAEQRAAAAQPQYDTDALEEWFSENPTRIPELAAQAYYQGQDQLLDAAIAAWEEIDRPAARKFERQIAVADARSEIYAESAQQQQLVADWDTTAQEFAAAHPDLEQVAPKMHELAPQYPHIVSVLRSGDPKSKMEVLEFLYEKARGRDTDNLATSARAIAREQAEEAEKAIKDAHVASAATAVTTATPSRAEAIAAEWDKADAPYTDGWKV